MCKFAINNTQRCETQQHRRFSESSAAERFSNVGPTHTCSSEFFAEICHEPDEIYQRSRKVCASLAHKRSRANDRARLVPLRVFRRGYEHFNWAATPPGLDSVGRDFPRRATAPAPSRRDHRYDLQRRPSGKKKCRRKIRKSVSPALKSPGTVREFLKDIRRPDI